MLRSVTLACPGPLEQDQSTIGSVPVGVWLSGCSLWGCRGVVEWVWSVGVVVGGVVCGRGDPGGG